MSRMTRQCCSGIVWVEQIQKYIYTFRVQYLNPTKSCTVVEYGKRKTLETCPVGQTTLLHYGQYKLFPL